ncbi:MAG: hypothetical protein IK151_02385 [Erysipelotrichaceae bacterium]|nr:hypothetical protein [Erysipelotrichaceae bacterium]
MQNKLLTYLFHVTTFILSWNLVTFILETFVSKRSYQFSISDDMITPLVISSVIFYFQYLKDRK